jgi:hypothetical protein
MIRRLTMYMSRLGAVDETLSISCTQSTQNPGKSPGLHFALMSWWQYKLRTLAAICGDPSHVANGSGRVYEGSPQPVGRGTVRDRGDHY